MVDIAMIDASGSIASPDLSFMSIYNHEYLPYEFTQKRRAYANILKVGEITLLLDCGVDEDYSELYLKHLCKVVKEEKVDYLLLTSSYITQAGALPYL
jgi:hypothetical protein